MTEELIKVTTDWDASYIVKTTSDGLKHLMKIDVWGKVFLIATHRCFRDKLTPVQEKYIALDSIDTIEQIIIDH